MVRQVIQAVGSLLRRRQVRRQLMLALHWLEQHRFEFTSSQTSGDNCNSALADLAWRVKPFAELIFLLMLFRRHQQCQAQTQPLHDFVQTHVTHFDLHKIAASDPSAATVLALFGDYFGCNTPDAPFEADYFAFLNQSGYFKGMDRMSYRDMDLVYSLWRLGYAPTTLRMDQMFANTAFGRGQFLPKYSIDDIYSLTHAIFYLTDVGFRPLSEVLDAETIARLRRDLIALTAIMLRDDNCDVLGELLLCWIFCHIKCSSYEQALFRLGMDRMLAIATPDGCVPYCTRSRARYLAGQDSFKAVYHPTLVATILFALAGEIL